MQSSNPPNVHVSRHPCLRAKLSQLRSSKASARETNALVQEISTIIGCEALASNLNVVPGGTDQTPLGYEYTIETINPEKLALIPILRSGLGMVQAIQTLLPSPVAVHHLGLFREPTTLQPVEYYNNLPFQRSSGGSTNSSAASLAILIDPVVATGNTAAAAIQTLREWGVDRIVFISIIGSETGLNRAASEWPEGVEVWVGGVDQQVNEKGMILPGLGDIGDRLFLAAGK